MRRIVALRALAASTSVAGCRVDAEPGPVLKGPDAIGDWRQDKPGLRELLTAKDLPPVSAHVPSEATVFRCRRARCRTFLPASQWSHHWGEGHVV